MPYGEDITINVGDAVRIHPNYKNYKFKKLKYGVTYLVTGTDEWADHITHLETGLGDTILLNMDKRYFEYVGKEENVEDKVSIEIGDVILVAKGGWGLLTEDEGKYVEVVGFGDYFDSLGVEVKPYQCQLETEEPGDDGCIGYESFGANPMILLNTKELKADVVNSPKHYAVFDGTEAIEIIASSLTQEEFRGYCFGNLLKYRLRCGKKDDVTQELNKADKYKELYEEHKHLCKE